MKIDDQSYIGIGREKRQRRGIILAVVLLAALTILVIALDGKAIWEVVKQAQWELIPFGLLLALVSHLTAGYGYAVINRLFAIPVGQKALLGIGFLSSVMIAAVGGLAGHSLRLLLMNRRGVSVGDTLAPSLFHSYFESLVFFALIPAGLIMLVLSHPLSDSMATTVILGCIILGLAFALTAIVFFWGPVRGAVLRSLRRIWLLILRRDINSAIDHFERTLLQGLSEVRHRPFALIFPMALIVIDRVTRVASLWICFEALGSEVELGVLLTGFAIGIALGVMSMVPGGIGVQEGSMVGAYALLGVPFERALVASILFRAVYYVLPFVLSLTLYWPMLREARRQGYLEPKQI